MISRKIILSKVLTVLLALLSCFSLLSQQLVSAADTTNFNIYMYMADNILSETDGQRKLLNYYLHDFETLPEILVNELNKNAGMMSSVVAWETLNVAVDPSEMTKKSIKAYQYYTEILLGMLNCSYEDENSKIVFEIAKMPGDPLSYYNSFLDFLNVNKEFELLNKLKTEDFDSFTDDQKKNMISMQKKWVKTQEHIYVKDFNIAMDVINTADDIRKSLDKMVEYAALSKINYEWQLSLQYMSQNCDQTNLALKQAINTCLTSSQSVQQGLSNVIIDSTFEFGSKASGILIKELTDALAQEFPFYQGVTVGGKAAKKLVNLLLSTDDTIENIILSRLTARYLTCSVVRSKLFRLHILTTERLKMQRYFLNI